MDVLDRLPQRGGGPTVDVRTRALAIWPGLDRKKLARTGGDPARVARLVERRTKHSIESIIRILEGPAEG